MCNVAMKSNLICVSRAFNLNFLMLLTIDLTDWLTAYWLTLSNTRPQTCMTNVTELDQRFANDLVSDQ